MVLGTNGVTRFLIEMCSGDIGTETIGLIQIIAQLRPGAKQAVKAGDLEQVLLARSIYLELFGYGSGTLACVALTISNGTATKQESIALAEILFNIACVWLNQGRRKVLYRSKKSY